MDDHGNTTGLRDELGQTFAEYALITSVIVLIAVAGYSAFGTALDAYIRAVVTAF